MRKELFNDMLAVAEIEIAKYGGGDGYAYLAGWLSMLVSEDVAERSLEWRRNNLAA
jgi:hypothetical protein